MNSEHPAREFLREFHPSERFEESTRGCAIRATNLVLLSALGYQLTEWFPAGELWSNVGVLLMLGALLLGVPWVSESMARLGNWWATRGYEVDE